MYVKLNVLSFVNVKQKKTSQYSVPQSTVRPPILNGWSLTLI